MHKGIHSRGYLSHWDFAKSVQGITFRLADAVPAKVIQGWLREPSLDRETDSRKFHQKIAKFEDAGHGSCLLADAEYAGIVQEALLGGHGTHYKLIAWCVMPNHVHVMIRLSGEASLGDIVKRWKAGSALQINRLMERTGSLWMRDYHDRWIRDMDHYEDSKVYIANNPVKAGLCESPEEWRFSSAGRGWDADRDCSTPPGEAK